MTLPPENGITCTFTSKLRAERTCQTRLPSWKVAGSRKRIAVRGYINYLLQRASPVNELVRFHVCLLPASCTEYIYIYSLAGGDYSSTRFYSWGCEIAFLRGKSFLAGFERWLLVKYRKIYGLCLFLMILSSNVKIMRNVYFFQVQRFIYTFIKAHCLNRN